MVKNYNDVDLGLIDPLAERYEKNPELMRMDDEEQVDDIYNIFTEPEEKPKLPFKLDEDFFDELELEQTKRHEREEDENELEEFLIKLDAIEP